jgi:hypothetical protein
MAIFTFSTKGSKPRDTEDVERIKKYCSDRGINFSHIVLTKLKEWENEQRSN